MLHSNQSSINVIFSLPCFQNFQRIDDWQSKKKITTCQREGERERKKNKCRVVFYWISHLSRQAREEWWDVNEMSPYRNVVNIAET